MLFAKNAIEGNNFGLLCTVSNTRTPPFELVNYVDMSGPIDRFTNIVLVICIK